jgi:glycosyltransferase involved in cell wall biosynthesis
MFLPSGWTVGSVCPREGVRYEIYGHGTDVDVALGLPSPLRRTLFRRLTEARAVHLPSREKLGRLGRAMGVDVLPAHFRVEAMVHATPVPTGDPVGHPAPTGERRLLFVGRLIAQKGVDDLLRAASLLPGCAVDVAGDGPERERLEQLASRLGVDAAFHGWVAGDPKWALFRRAGVLCVPSRDHGSLSEGAPLVIEEARAMGVPIVAAATGGIPELCDGYEDATLVPAGEPRRLAQAIESTLARRGLRQTG